MLTVPVARLAQALGVSSTSGEMIRRTSFDSRDVRAGDCFVALKGRFTDASKLIPEARQRGAVCAIGGPGADPGDSVFRLPDPTLGLIALAGLVRDQFTGRVVGITGTAGKTTVKENLAQLLRATKTRVVAAEASHNNREGVPRTLTRIEADTEVAVVEIGTNAPGEIAELSALARPTMGILTSIGPGHLQGLHSVAGVLREKLDLARALPYASTLVINQDDSRLASADYPAGLRIVRASLRSGPGLMAPLEMRPGQLVAPTGERLVHRVESEVGVRNLWIAAVAAHELGCTWSDLALGTPGIAPAKWRGESRQFDRATLILDFYNANPLSMEAALSEFARRPGRLGLVVGEMRELGAASESFHEQLGQWIARARAEFVIYVGQFASSVTRGFVVGGASAGTLQVFPSVAEARPLFVARCAEEFTILMKASRGIALEQFLEAAHA